MYGAPSPQVRAAIDGGKVGDYRDRLAVALARKVCVPPPSPRPQPCVVDQAGWWTPRSLQKERFGWLETTPKVPLPHRTFLGMYSPPIAPLHP